MTQQIERWTLFAAILASAMAFIDGSALNVILPVLQASLHASGGQLLWVINGYLLMLAALILVGGSLGDRLGRKRVYITGIILFMAASLSCGLAQSIQGMIVSRVVSGIGGALMIPGSLSLINALTDPSRRGRAIGTWSSITTLVTIIGPVLGGVLADAGIWRGVFFINLPIGAVALWILARKVPESRDEGAIGTIDVAGVILTMVGLGALAYGFITAPDAGFQDPQIYLSLAVGVAALIAFVIVEARVRYPIMPLNLFKSRAFSGANLLTLSLYGALNVVSFFFSLNLVQVQGYSKTEAGLAFLPFAFLLTTLSRFAGGFVDRSGPRLPLIVGPALVGCGFLYLSFIGITEGPRSYWTTFLPAILLYGVGMGFTVAPLTTTVMKSVPTEHSGTASGINNAVSRTAGVLALAVIGSVALFVFASSLTANTTRFNLDPSARAALLSQSHNLGGATVPPQVSPSDTLKVQAAIRVSFVNTFQIIMRICAGLAWISALAAAVLIDNPRKGQEPGLGD